MGDLDQISLKIGGIEQMLIEGIRQRDQMSWKLDELGKNLAEVYGTTKSVHEGHTALKQVVDGTIIPEIKDLRSMKNKGMGFLAGVTLVAGGAGAGFAKLFSKLISD